MKIDLSLIRKIHSPELTTKMLIGLLSNYSDPRKKINSLAKNGLLIPIKQGVYLLNDEVGLRPYSKEILANLIYGPSYISLETALGHYGFIPERVNTTTSICFGRGKSFTTTVGVFEYHHIKNTIYPYGVQLKEIFEGVYCQFAGPEKALLDFIYIRESMVGVKTSADFFKYIFESYRFDLAEIANQISLRKIQDLSLWYPYKNIRWFADELTRKLVK